LRTLNPKETFIINVASKPLPFKGWRTNYVTWNKDNPMGNFVNTSDVEAISKILQYINTKREEIKNIVIEDSQYLMAFEAMDRAKEKGFEKFIEIGQRFYSILKAGISMRDDLNVIVLCHAENMGDALNPVYKIKTIGKMLDNMVTVEGLFTYVLFTDIQIGENGESNYYFVTKSDGTNTAKTPMGCFDDRFIPNDMQYVIDKINEFNS
jgi:hypothetical protein